MKFRFWNLINMGPRWCCQAQGVVIPSNIDVKSREVEYNNVDEHLLRSQFIQTKPNFAQTLYWNGNFQFGFNLLHKLLSSSSQHHENEQSVLLSSFSISSVFGMLLASMDEKNPTTTELIKTLHFPMHESQIQQPTDLSKLIIEEQSSLIKALNTKKTNRLKIGNRVYYNQKSNLQLDKTLKHLFDITGENSLQPNVSQYFDNAFQSMDFSDASTTANYINKWVETLTNNKIKTIVNPNDFKTNNLLASVIVNAIYFKAEWETEFMGDRTTDNAQFYTNNTRDSIVNKQISMMHQTRHIDYYKYFVGYNPHKSKFKYLKIPLNNGNGKNDSELYVLLCLSTENNINYETELSYSDLKDAMYLFANKNGKKYKKYLSSIVKDFKYIDEFNVNLYLPKFKLECEFNGLGKTLGKLGMEKVFSSESNDLFVSKVAHKTFFEVWISLFFFFFFFFFFMNQKHIVCDR